MKHFVTLVTAFAVSFNVGLVQAQESFSPCDHCLPNVPGTITHSAFGDYNNDGALDLILGGYTNGSQTPYTYLYTNNGSGSFTRNTAVNITALTNGDISWADYDRDGYLDFAIMGYSMSSGIDSSAHLQVYRNLHNNSFSSPIELTGMGYGGLDWCDYDGDGDPDLLATGASGKSSNSRYYTLLYRTESNGSFTLVSTALPALCWGNAKWGDYDNDGDPDIVICGQQSIIGHTPTYTAAVTSIYRNDRNGIFTDVGAGLTAVSGAYAAWADYDNDGKLDLALQGSSSGGPVLKVYRNQNDTFVDLNLNLSGNYSANLVWSDLNGDNKPDLISAGRNGNKVFLQTDINQFTINQSINSTDPVSAADCNGDRKPDLTCSGADPLFNNRNTGAAAVPGTPGNLQARTIGNSVLLKWDQPSDNTALPHGLTYNLRLAMPPANGYTISPMSIPETGFRQIVRDGNAGHRTSYILRNLAPGTYNWSVQSQNAAGQASAFAAQGSFTSSGQNNGIYVYNSGSDTLCYGASTTLEALVYPAAPNYQWYRNDVAIQGANSSRYTASQPGTYKVTAGSALSEGVNIWNYPAMSTPAVPNVSVCGAQTITMNAVPGAGANSCLWYDSNNNYLGVGASYTPDPAPVSTSSYKVYSYNSVTGCQTQDYTTAVAAIHPVPDAPVTLDQTACQAQVFVLRATPGANGNTCKWYNHSGSHSALAQDTTFTTEMLSQSATWHVSTYNTGTLCESATRTPVTASVDPLGQPVTVDAVLCVPGSATLLATPAPNATTCNWYVHYNDTTPFYTGTSLTVPNQGASQTFFVTSVNTADHCESADRNPATITVGPGIAPPATWNQQRYGNSAVTLEAWPGSGATTCRWYANASKTSLLATGKTYTTPVLSAAITTYYVSSYDEAHGCEGADAVPVQVQILPLPSMPVNPDQVYPVPNLYGSDFYKNVNKFTGDVNLSFTLADIKGPFISYSLDAFYNSRSAGITPLYTQNPLGGLGWKLMDYPKIVQDATAAYFLLDGLQAYPLTQSSRTDSEIRFSASGDYHQWTVSQENLQQPTENRRWTLVSDDGTQYVFRTTAINHLDNNQPGYRWDLSAIREVQGRDSILFTYQNGNLQQIKTSDFNTWTFNYDNLQRIASIEETVEAITANVRYPETKTTLSYDNIFPSTGYTQLSSLALQQNVAPFTYSEAQYQTAAPPVNFTYNHSNFPGALETIQIPQGGTIEYEYTSFPLEGIQYQIVTGVNTFSGTTFSQHERTQYQHSPAALRFTGPKVSGDKTYLHFNKCEVLPGGNQIFRSIGDQVTSFETGTTDPVFCNLTAGSFSTDYALSGSTSYKVQMNLLDIASNLFSLPRKRFNVYGNAQAGTPVTMKGSEDSVRVAFYLFDTHQSFVDVRLFVSVYFYDAQHNALMNGIFHETIDYVDDGKYGNWMPMEAVVAIPSDAAYFGFEITGQNPGTSYYLDDVSVTGSHTTLNGREVIYFFNGGQKSELAHLPADYFTLYHDRQVTALYETGFEPGQAYADWLNLDHSSDCKPKAKVNDATRQISYSGSGALRMRACDDDNYSRLYPKDSLNVPSGTDRVLLCFNYSSPQFGGLQFQVQGNVGANYWDTIITATGNYYTQASYTLFYKWFNVTHTEDDFNFVIRVLNTSGGRELNEFFLDDLRVVFIDADAAASIPNPQIASPAYLGLSYHYASSTQNNQELSAGESFWMDVRDATAGNTLLAQPYRTLNVEKGVAKEYLSYTYRPDGRVSSTHTTRDVEQTDGTYQQALYLDEYVYADSVYPALGRQGLHMLNALAATVSSYSVDQGSHWTMSSANLATWSTLAPQAPEQGTALGPIWASTATYVPKTAMSLNSVYTAIRHLATREPDGATWTSSNKVLGLNINGQASQNRSADSLIAWTLYSQNQAEDRYNRKWFRNPVAVAQFSDATPQNSFYYGFEPYETTPPGANDFEVSTGYYYTGAQSGLGTFSCTLPFTQGETPGSTYLVAFQYMVVGSYGGSVKLTVLGNTADTIYTHTYTVTAYEGKAWQSVQHVVNIPAGLTRLTLKLEGVTGNHSATFYFDDLRVLPATSGFSATTYQLEDYSIRSVLDNNGAVMRFLYNWRGEQYATVGPGKTPLQYSTRYFSRMATAASNDYNPLIPNNSFQIKARDGGHYFAFNDEADRTGWSFSNPSSARFSADKLTLSQTATAYVASVWRPANYSNFGLSCQLFPVLNNNGSADAGFLVGTSQIGVHFERSNSQLKVIVYLANGRNYISLDTFIYPGSNSQPAYDLIVVLQANRVHIWFDGRYVSNTYTYTAPAAGTGAGLFYTFRTAGAAGVSFTDFSIFNAPEIRAVFSDGLENTLQEQQVNGNDLIVKETQYDLMYRPVLQTKDVLLTDRRPGFQTGFITSFDWETGEMRGDVQDARHYVDDGSADQKYMYWRCVWNGAPSKQLNALYKPGYEFALRKNTNWEKAERWAYTHEEQIFTAIKYSLDVVQIIIDPESAPMVIGMDLLGLVRKHYKHTTDNPEKEEAVTSKFYNPIQQQIQIKLPKANATKHPKHKQMLGFAYDFNGNLIMECSPESDTIRYAYNHLGQLRFSQDPQQAYSRLIVYYKYDRWGRPVEKGVVSSAWDQGTLENLAENSAYPASGGTLQYTYFYDGTQEPEAYLSPNRGYLTQQGCFQNNTISSITKTGYDLNGHVIQTDLTITANGTGTEYSTQYQYDAADNIKMVKYPVRNRSRFYVRYYYDYVGNLTQIGDSLTTDKYLSYEYNPDGSVHRENLRRTDRSILPVQHAYNAVGWQSYSGFGEKSNKKYSYFSNAFNYNLLTDWWSELWGQEYFNGNLSSSTYQPGPSNPAKELKQGYLYNEYGNMSGNYNNYEYDHINALGFEKNKFKDDFTFDLNNNLLSRVFTSTGKEAHAGYYYHLSDDHNRAGYMAYTEYFKQNNVVHHRDDTLDITYNLQGNINQLNWRHRNTTTSSQAGSIAFEYWKRLNWSDFGQATSMSYRDTGGDSIRCTFSYDTKGMRVQKASTWYRNSTLRRSSTTTYIRNGNGDPLMELITGGARDTAKYYIWGIDGIAVMCMDDGAAFQSWFVLKDNQGSARQLVDRADGSVDEYYATNSYGALLPDNTLYKGLFNYIYTGQEYDPETQLHYFRARMYDPFSKLFLSPDPAGSNPAIPYAFVNNNPANATDPTGEIPFDEILDASEWEIRFAKNKFGNLSTKRLLRNIERMSVENLSRDDKKMMIEFRRRFNSKTHEVEMLQIFGDDTWNNKMKDVLRPGGMHEMLPVGGWYQLRKLGIKLDDIQEVTKPTTKTFFQINEPGNVRYVAKHGSSIDLEANEDLKRRLVARGYDAKNKSIGSTKAHNELFEIIDDAEKNKLTKEQFLNKMEEWLKGTDDQFLMKASDKALDYWLNKINRIR